MKKKPPEVTYNCIYTDCNRGFPSRSKLEKHLKLEYKKKRPSFKIKHTVKDMVTCFCCSTSDIARGLRVSRKSIEREIKAGNLRAHKSKVNSGKYHILNKDAFRYMKQFNFSALKFGYGRKFKARYADKYRRGFERTGVHKCCKLAEKNSKEL